MGTAQDVFIERCGSYDSETVTEALKSLEPLFDEIVQPGDHVVVKPNWIAPHHRYDVSEWMSVITHPSVITAVIERVAPRLRGRGSMVITDGPQTDSSFAAILARMPVGAWESAASRCGVPLQIVDLRELEWEERGDVIFNRRRLPGDPRG